MKLIFFTPAGIFRIIQLENVNEVKLSEGFLDRKARQFMALLEQCKLIGFELRN